MRAGQDFHRQGWGKRKGRAYWQSKDIEKGK
jgi:hypothetical protein